MTAEADPRWKREYAVLRANPERWERHKATVRRRQLERYHSDPAYREKHLAVSGNSQKIARRDPVGWAKRMIHRLRYKCKDGAIPFDITWQDIHVPEVCPVFGTPFVWGGVNGYKDRHSPSLDRVIPELGYVKGNIRVICNRANTIKNDATAEELLKIAAYIVNNIERTHSHG